jgi:uncharacterized protein (TIGR00266 family)
MDYKILHGEAFPVLEVKLSAGEKVKAESNAMVTMTDSINLESKMEGGVFAGIGRMLAGEKFFFQTMSVEEGEGTVLLAPTVMGSIVDVELDGTYGMCVQKDGFLAATEGIKLETKMQNLFQGLLSGEGFMILKTKGEGKVFLNSLGSIHPIELAEEEELIVDNGHLVAWPDNMSYKMEKATKGWISSFTSGEGIVCRFKGPGVILIQTRNPKDFSSWLQTILPKKGENKFPFKV